MRSRPIGRSGGIFACAGLVRGDVRTRARLAGRARWGFALSAAWSRVPKAGWSRWWARGCSRRAVVVSGCRGVRGPSGREQPGCDGRRWREPVRCHGVCGDSAGGSLRRGLVPGEQDAQVDGEDHQGEKDGLGDAAMSEPPAGVGDIDAVALGSAVQTLDVGPAGPVGVLPPRVEVVPVLSVLVGAGEVGLWAPAVTVPDALPGRAGSRRWGRRKRCPGGRSRG
jgi:hypothetical protein